MTEKKRTGKRILLIVISVLAAVFIGFGAVYNYYSTGNGAEDPKNFISIRGLNNAEDMVQIGDTRWILTGNLGDKSWKKGGLYLIDSESLEWKEAEIDFSSAPAEGYEEIAQRFEGVGKIEKEHEERYRALLKNIDDDVVFKGDAITVWKCRNCGYITVGETAPETCPVCDHPQSFFEKRIINW